MPEISVLVPSYNHAPFVERTLRSIFAQTLRPKKLIVIDDGSKDESAAVIARVLRDCPFENELIARENRGLCATLNEGFALGEGDYFAYLGSDDLWLPEFLAENMALLEKRSEAVLAFGHAYIIDEDDRIFDRTDNWTPFADGDLLPMLLRGEVFSSPGVVYRRAPLEKHRWNEAARLEDYEMYLKLTTEGEFARSDKILCAWRQHASNASGNYGEMFPEFIAAQNRLADRLPVGREELRKAQTELKFRAVADFIRSGNRREALSLLVKNVGGAQSPAQIVKMLLRLAVPQRLFQWNRRRKKLRAAERYGKLDLNRTR
ncbi:MAG: glycosyltransferase family A protein [Pyrinomonadaceae bacterium]